MATMRWQDHVQTGDHASRPAASATAVDALYSCTDHGIIYQSDGSSTWSDYYDPDDATLTTHEAAADPHTVYVKESEFTGADIILIGTGAGTLTAFKHNFSATADPTATDDSAAGYGEGSVWIDVTNDKSWVCVDDTATAAVWQQTGGTGAGTTDHGALSGLSDDDHPQYVKDSEFTGDDIALLGTGAGTFEAWKHNFAASAAPGSTDDSASGYGVGSIWIDTTGDKVYICYDATASAALWQEVGAGGGGAALTVTDESGTVSDTAVTSITVPDGTLVDNGVGDVTLREVPTGVVGAKAYNSTTQGSLAAATYNKLSLDSEYWDTDGFHDTATNNTRLTVPAGLAGKYLVNAWTYGVTTTWTPYIYVNGTPVYAGTNVTNTIGNATTILDLAVGDYVEFGEYHASGTLTAGFASGAELQSTLQMVKLGTGTVGESIGANVYASAAQSVANATIVQLTYDTVEWDTDSYFDNVADQLVVPAGLGGTYLLTARTTFASDTDGGRYLICNVNGSEVGREGQTPGTGTRTLDLSLPLVLAAGDTVDISVAHYAGANLAVGSATKAQASWFGLTLLATQGSGGLKEGTAFPTGPTTGQRFRRSDLDYAVFFYDGTRWLSEQQYIAHGTSQHGLTAAASSWWNFPTDGLDVWLERWVANAYSTGLSGSAYWGFVLQKGNLSNSYTSIDTTDLSAASSGVWTPYAADVGEVIDVSTYPTLRVDISKTGSPGPLYTGPVVIYRLIAT